jgi:biotin transport system substrate-specific component
VNREMISPVVGSERWTSAPAWLRTVGVVLGGTAFLALCAHIALPLWFTPVPLTLQPFGVLVLGLLLSPRMAGTTLVAYLAEGALGLPVFTPNTAALTGMAHLLGATGGYLLAYPAAAVLIAWMSRRMGRGFTAMLVSAAVGDGLILLCGALWIAASAHAALGTALALGMAPFLPGDALKVVAAAGAAMGWKRLRR